MAYNKAREEKKWRLWKEAEEKQLRSLGVSENDIEKLRVHDWAIFNSDRRYYQRMQETGTYLEEVVADMTQPEIKTVADFLNNIENQQLYQVLIKVDGIHLDRIWCFTVRHCMSVMNRGAGLFVNGWDGFVLDNWLTGNGMGGLYSDEVCSSITMTGNRVEWNDHAGVDLRTSKCCSFTGNYFDRSHGPAISIRGRAGDDVSDTISITGNVFNRNGGGDLQEKAPEDPMDDAHIRLERCVNCVVTGNVCRAGMNDGPGRLSPAYAFAIRQLRACIIRDNTVQSGMTVDTLLDRGEHENDVVVRDNLGQPTKTLDPWYPRFEKDKQ